MAFDWMQATAPLRRTGDDSRVAMYRRELSERAGLLSRLGYPAKRTLARLQANANWDFDTTGVARPEGLSDKDIAAIVKMTYQRHPGR